MIDYGRPSFNNYFQKLAAAVSERSDCERSRVGAVIVDRDNRVVSTGYNGSPPGFPGCSTCPRRTSSCEPGSSYDTGPGACVALHAEQNAVLYADRADRIGSTIYITREPCGGCLKLLRGSLLKLAIWPTGYVYLQNKE